jgi:type I restriction enzyme, S subunit
LAIDYVSGGTPSTKDKNYWKGNIPWMRSAWISGRYVTRGERHITAEALENSATNVVPANSLLIATRVSIGNAAINRIPIAISQDLTGVVVNKEKADPEFLYWKVKASERAIRRLIQGSTIKGILREDLQKLPLTVPLKVPEQRRIVEVLSSTDDAVESTKTILAEVDRLKKGLLQRLLTHGIGGHALRNTQIGPLPESWQVQSLRELISESKNGFASGKRTADGVIQLRLDSLELSGRINVHNYVQVPAPPGWEEYLVKQDDILIANTSGSIDHVGKSVVFRGEFDTCVFSNHLTRLRAKSTLIRPGWLHMVLYRYWQQGVLRRRAVSQAGGQRNLPTPDLLSLCIPVPPIPEQDRAVKVVGAVEDKLQQERNTLDAFEALRGGLSRDLLEGRLRVRV